MSRVRLRKGNVQAVWAGHPWVFSQAIASVEGAPSAGDAVDVVDPQDRFLGRGFWSPKSAIPVRILSREPSAAFDTAWFAERIESAVQLRKSFALPGPDTDGYRLIHSEGDRLGGLVVDVYGDTLVVQFGTIGMKRREEAIFAALSRSTSARRIVELGVKAQRLEGFESEDRVVRGEEGRELRFSERGLSYRIDTALGQKTGFYFDQRDQRARIEALAQGRRVLDLCSYIGAFSLAALRGGASEVLAVDSSAAALAAATTLVKEQGWSQRFRIQRGEMRRELAALLKSKERFDLVIVDPPKLAPTIRHLNAARSVYRQVNRGAFELLGAGGIALSCSCSAAMRHEDFLRTLGMAARDAARQATVIGLGGQGVDHPTPAVFEEGRYLKCAFLQVSA